MVSSRERVLFDSLPDLVWTRRADGLVLDANQAALARLGYARSEFVGRRILDFHFDPARDRESHLRFGERALKGKSAFYRVTLRSKSGKPVELELHGSRFESEDGPVVLVVARDIGLQLHDERLARTLSEAFRRSNDVMFYSDRNGVILDVNDAFVRTYGWTHDEAVGQGPRILRSRHSTKPMYERMWSAILNEGYWRGQIINRAKDGREIPLVLTITSVRDAEGQVIGYISNGVDISEQTALQARVAHAESMAAVGEMAAVVAHEIRNPLSSIVMAAKQLADGALTAQDALIVRGVLQSESRRLSETLTNFLNYARPRELKSAPTDLNALVEDVLRMVQADAELLGETRVEQTLSPELKPLLIDADQIRQVLWNLVINGLEAMERRGRLSVSTGREGAFAYLRVADTGPGIPPSLHETLFRPFLTTKQKGTGLGLPIAERIAKAHGGRIDFTSSHSGACFTILLPMRAP